MAPLIFILILASVFCFVAKGLGHDWGLGWGLAALTTALALLPRMLTLG
ncbi:MAG: hypothetical protein ACRDSK_13700 [Actinophytocola sp.]